MPNKPNEESQIFHLMKIPGELVDGGALLKLDAPATPEEEADFYAAMNIIRQAERIDPIDLMRRLGSSALQSLTKH